MQCHPSSSGVIMGIYPLNISLQHLPRNFDGWYFLSVFSTPSVNMLYLSRSLSQVSSKSFLMRNHSVWNFVHIRLILERHQLHGFLHKLKWALCTFAMSVLRHSSHLSMFSLHTFLPSYLFMVAYGTSSMALYMHRSNYIAVPVRTKS